MTNEINRHDFLKMASAGLVALLMPEIAEAAGGMSYNYARIHDFDFGYKEIVKEPHFSSLELADIKTEIGKVQRTLRFSNITDAVCKRYGVPNRIPLGMICSESEGDPTKPNSSGDGGAGLIHMQPLTASNYGLRLITPSKKLVDHEQGKLIRAAIKRTNGDLKRLIKYDDRFHPIKNVDAAMRMLSDFHEVRKTWIGTFERFSGRPASEYGSKVMNYSAKIGSPNFMQKVKEDFEKRNEGATVNGRYLTFERYLKVFHDLNRNYGLDVYKNLGKHLVG